jgi:hypothetical protein
MTETETPITQEFLGIKKLLLTCCLNIIRNRDLFIGAVSAPSFGGLPNEGFFYFYSG